VNARPEDPTPARLYALLAGFLLMIAGVAGFFYESSLALGDDLVADDVAGIWATNGWLNLLYLLAGIAGLWSATREPQLFSLVAGAGFALLAVAGFVALDGQFGTLFDVLPLSPEGNLINLLAGAGGLAAWALTRAEGPRG
jgi:hypothetical protein